MVQNFKKEIAISLRQDGFSYSSISDQIRVPKSTIVFWLRKIKLTQVQTEKIKKRRLESQKLSIQKKVSRTFHQIEQIKKYSSKDIRDISKKELWLMGIMLYWRERYSNNNESDLKKGVRFTSSDPYLIKFFLKWLKDIGKIENDEISFDLFINAEVSETELITKYWSNITEFDKDKFHHIYKLGSKSKSIKSNKNKKSKRHYHKIQNGLLRIRVRASSMLARQIAGWTKGIANYYWKEQSD
jgi:hypothetical protein